MRTEIEKYNPCSDAVEYRKQFDSFKEAWEKCPRGDWMLWLAEEVGIDLKTITLAKALCANTVKHLMEDKLSIHAINIAIEFGKNRATRKELDAAANAAYATANATYATAYDAAAAADATANVATYAAANVAAYAAANAADATDAAYAAAYAADATANVAGNVAADAAAYAAYATANAAYAAYTANATYAAAYATANATYDAACAAYAADAADVAADAKKKNQMETADICREYLTKEVYQKLKVIKNKNNFC